MKKMYLLIAVIIAACANLMNVQAQTDVTSTYLTNAGFDSNCNYLVATTADNLGSANGGVNILAVEGWTKGLTGDNSAAASFEYGYAGTLNISGATGYIPTAGYTDPTSVGCLGISVAWSGTVTYYQDVTLPAGKYTIEYAAYNSGPAVADICKLGWVPNSGTSVLSTKTTFDMGAWTTESINITLASETTGKIQVGLSAINSGSGGNGRIFFDYVKIILNDVDKTTLEGLITTANGMISSPEPVGASTAYTDLSTAVSAAQAVVDNSFATAAEVISQEDALTAAIAAVNSAIELESRVSTWTTYPYDATSVIVNPTINGTSNSVAPEGWTASKGTGNTFTTTGQHYSLDATNRYIDSWNGTAGSMLYNAYQTINNLPNGTYRLTSAARTSGSGSYVYAKTSGKTYRTEIINNGGAGGTLGNGFSTITVEVPVIDHTLTIGVTTDQSVSGGSAWTGTWFSADDFTLTFDGEVKVLTVSETSLLFDANNLTKTFNVSGAFLTDGVTLSAPVGITLNKTSLTALEAQNGTTITAEFTGSSTILGGEISIVSGSLTKTITVNASSDESCFTPLYTTLTNLITDPYCNSLSSFAGWGSRSVVTDYVYCGLSSIKLSGQCGGSLDYILTGKIEGGKTYRVRAMVSTNGTGETKIGISGATAELITNTITTAAGEWLPIDFTFTAQETITSANMYLNSCESQTATESYIDNYEMYDITSISTGTKVVNSELCSAFVRDNNVVVKLNLAMSGEVEIALYNVNGMLINSQKSVCVNGSSEKVLNTNLQNGIYFVKVTTAGKSVTQKIVK